MKWPSFSNPKWKSSFHSKNLVSSFLWVKQSKLFLFVKELNPVWAMLWRREDQLIKKTEPRMWVPLPPAELPALSMSVSCSHVLCCKRHCRGGRKHQALIVIPNVSQCWGRKSKYFIEKVVAYNVKFIDKEGSDSFKFFLLATSARIRLVKPVDISSGKFLWSVVENCIYFSLLVCSIELINTEICCRSPSDKQLELWLR